jgi:hypothetical protein
VLVMQVEQGAELGTQMNMDMECSVPWSRKCNLPIKNGKEIAVSYSGLPHEVIKSNFSAFKSTTQS